MKKRTSVRPQQSRKDTLLDVQENTLLMPFLLEQLRHKNRDNIKSLLRGKQVWINGQAISQYNHPLQPGVKVLIRWNLAGSGDLYRNIRIVFEDDHLIVIDKQAGLLSISAGGEHETAYRILSRHVKFMNPDSRIFVVHRLDRDTSGLMMFAKNEEVQRILQTTWQTSISERVYTALVEGEVEKPAGTIQSYLYESKSLIVHSSQDPAKGDLAITHYTTLKKNKNYSMLEVNLETGKKNQIRVHLQDIGHSIVGDRKYGATGNPIGRLGLHATTLAFRHPVTDEPLRFTADIPGKFQRLFIP